MGGDGAYGHLAVGELAAGFVGQLDDQLEVCLLYTSLINEGYEGEDLIAQYKAMKKKVVSVKDKLDEAERDIAEGRVGSAREMQNRMREKYGLYGQ